MQKEPERSSVSYWQSTLAAYPLETTPPTIADVVVVGGGVLGCSAAYWLARAGLHPVLLEQSAVAYGATGRNGGFISYHSALGFLAENELLGHQTALAILHLTRENQRLLRQILEEEQLDCQYREPGIISLALNESQREHMARNVAALQAEGMRIHLLDRQGLQEYIATELGPEIVGGELYAEAGLIHSGRLVQGLAQAAQRHGARLYQATVRQVQTSGNTVRLDTEHGTLEARAAIIATNAWTANLLPALRGLVVPVRGQALSYAPREPVFHTGLGAGVTATGEYWQQTIDGSLLLGGCREVAPEQDKGVTIQQPTAEVQQALEQVFPRLFPRLQGLQVQRRWAGLMAFTPDYLPIIDQAPEMSTVWAGCGFCGHGMPFGIRVGQLLAQAVQHGSTLEELAPFSLRRPSLKRS
ncbi:glycine/D-amino acid oxidase-like deaminating enzyme [Thermosporothrix hazakensis]|uniref:Glycine/D-amino acid oxidase-like deaminating enzyme n=1 Tax=Thermosporothrix hazakensis TaxID=644383 RepID=A0A326UPM1_THEHA|nr:FAD-binding oxidoreductase [Thermosporothrix hazakensis]PZW36139.1 glycine/D-amino acid oxidase-like deaminating enzyme [Thermosporothrix hazakensis]GCE46790.1 FAD-dependent oxidoreductase [Thermosporothrix hazakensis]